MTRLQREFAEGHLVLPDARPAGISARAWAVLVRHVRDRVPYATLAAEWQITEPTTRRLAEWAAAALQYPDLAELPSAARRALRLGGYTTRESIAQASDADLLLLKRLNTARLRQVRAVIPRAE
jgi:hypothetical protein